MWEQWKEGAMNRSWRLAFFSGVPTILYVGDATINAGWRSYHRRSFAGIERGPGSSGRVFVGRRRSPAVPNDF
jgi:hypothetical protein